ncbi:uncharacterized protein GIQ15_03418 [Arthroderma uncinatum]|uniref:uncharacterized protein n=1 Tax=Arthroderma uncinatum TaxID=74035 RepID=UPI00144A8169|nr:uncharacterized protein GIQ15_03418 [Arthroderma uncinatum]KAF3484094.1 hypothetical protein GIQ15_03418 [Arthroderma uncinatum]
MSLDFDSYFRKLDPQNTWIVKRLTGGLVNVTVRAVRDDANKQNTAADKPGPFGKHQSLILKYAPPFVASVGEGAPFDQIRQIVEKNALTLFSEPDGPLKLMTSKASVRVPGLISHDEEHHILVLEDLGTLPPLSDHLSASWLPSQSSTWPSLTGTLLLENHKLCLCIGEKLGEFFADFHAEETLNSIKSYGNDPTMTWFENGSMKEVVREAAVSTIRRYLCQFNCVESEELSKIVEEDFERQEVFDGEQCFNVGDLWPGGILIGLPSKTSQDLTAVVEENNIGVIDFEFSGLGRGVNGDMAQLLAHLHLYSIAWGNCGEQFKPIHKGVLALAEGLCSSYTRHSYSAKAPWQLYSASLQPPASSHAAGIFRSALILHGREVINNAVENDWSSYCIKTFDDSQRADGKDTNLTRKMVDTGVSCLQMAGRTIEEFVQADNWKRVCCSKESSMIARLFNVGS